MSISDGVPATAANLNAAFVSLSAENNFPEEQTYEKGLIVKEIATPATPASGYLALYAKTDGEAYVKNDAGTETKISNANPSLQNSYQLENYSIAASVAASALTIALKSNAGTDASSSDPVTIAFRSSTAASGVYVRRTVTSALSLVVSSGSTLGHVSGQAHFLYVYAIDNAGTVELAVSSTRYDDGTRVTTTAEGGAGAADSYLTIYSTTARTDVALRLICRLKSTQATAGTWATAISEISPVPFLASQIIYDANVQERMCTALVTNPSGTASITRQSMPWITSVNRASAGVVDVVVATGVFSAVPVIIVTAQASVNADIFAGINDTPTATAFTIVTRNAAGTGVDADLNILCIGPR